MAVLYNEIKNIDKNIIKKILENLQIIQPGLET